MRESSDVRLHDNKYIVLFALGLLLANFTIKTTYPQPAIWMIALVFFVLYSFIFFINKSDVSYFIIFLIFGCHFNFAINQGGLFNLLAFIGLLFKVFSKNKDFFYSVNRIPRVIKLLFLILITTNLLSTLLNNTGTFTQQLYGIVSFLSSILVFFFSMHAFKDKNFILFLKVIILLCVFNFGVAINQRFLGIFLNTPLFPLVI